MTLSLIHILAIEPEIVLLDEPFSSLDAGLRATVRADVQRVLRHAGTTALLVTHNQDEALSMACLLYTSSKVSERTSGPEPTIPALSTPSSW